MNKAELIEHIAETANLSATQAKAALEAAVSGITNALACAEQVELKGFGTFKVTERAERPGRNPKTGETMVIPASKVPSFKAGSKLKEAVK